MLHDENYEDNIDSIFFPNVQLVYAVYKKHNNMYTPELIAS